MGIVLFPACSLKLTSRHHRRQARYATRYFRKSNWLQSFKKITDYILNILLTGALCRPAPRRLPASRMPEVAISAIRHIKRAGIPLPGSASFVLATGTGFIRVMLLTGQRRFQHSRVFLQRYLNEQPGLQFSILRYQGIRGPLQLSA